MRAPEMKITYIGGPTALLEIAGLRLLTDPTFDPEGQEYHPGPYTLRKTMGPAVSPESLGPVDAVLLSHDHHADNLDLAGRAFLKNAAKVITTSVGAERLGNGTIGLTAWQSIELASGENGLRVTATPARHGPANGDRGPVIGFVLTRADGSGDAIYLSGDTVWYEGVAEVGRRFSISTAVLFMGAARVKEVGPAHLTFSAEDGIEFAKAFPRTKIVPLHYEGWQHFSESRDYITKCFAESNLEDRLQWLPAGREIAIGG